MLRITIGAVGEHNEFEVALLDDVGNSVEEVDFRVLLHHEAAVDDEVVKVRLLGDLVREAVLGRLTGQLTVLRVLFRLQDLQLEIKHYFSFRAAEGNDFLLVEKEDVSRASLVQHQLLGCLSVCPEDDRVGHEEGVSAPDALLLGVLIEGDNSEVLGVSGWVRLFFLQHAVPVLVEAEHIILLLFMGVDLSRLVGFILL